MTSSSKTSHDAPSAIKLETNDNSKQLLLQQKAPDPYTGDLCFRIDVASATVQASGPFQISPAGLSAFQDAWHANKKAELLDVNGDGRILLETIDQLGHFKVTVQVGGPWADQAQLSFDTDQTAVIPFIDAVRSAVNRRGRGKALGKVGRGGTE
ncbi:hypothetical protein G7068_04575 [Leucobacter viscericola]|uniref:Uncharacterized protein n=1 Tax=Leucobacter viscericola TaxID=2714935 RepID=A0A6G7XD93_9MICO|nr:hypothetical protein [Leucobacter viscericola]QIK62564.1 hypothetical protein G7068_04575 [Leucobacter viscericola]